MKNCIVNSFFDLSGCLAWSGENDIEFNGNYFGDVLTFEDTYFHNDLIFKNNKLIVGCDLVTEKQLACFYPITSVIIDNYGIMNLSEQEENKHWMRIRNMHNIK